MVEAAFLTLALWCVLLALRVLPGPLQQVPGTAGMLLVGAALGVLRMRRLLIAGLIAATLAVALVVFTPIADTIAEQWPRNDTARLSTMNAVVVLSGGLNPDTTIGVEALDHLVMGIELARDRHIPLVTTSTTEVFPGPRLVDGEVDQGRIVRLANLGGSWIRVAGGETTRDEAVSAAASLQPRGWRHVAVVTSPIHTRRACAAFERVGFTVTCVAARMRGSEALPFVSNPGDRLAVFGDWVYEMAALAKYRVMGWVAR